MKTAGNTVDETVPRMGLSLGEGQERRRGAGAAAERGEGRRGRSRRPATGYRYTRVALVWSVLEVGAAGDGLPGGQFCTGVVQAC
jgi:hypothetical protein